MFLPVRVAGVIAFCSLLAASLSAGEKPITLGLMTDGSTREERAPLQAYLTRAMGRTVNLAMADHYSEIMGHLADGSYDFAYMGGLTYIRSRAKYGVIPLVQRTADLNFHSVFITRVGSPIFSLRDLLGKQIALGDINSTSGHLIPYRELKQAGIDPENDLKCRYSGSHPATAALVQLGVVDAGALDENLFTALVAAGKLDGSKIRVFYTSKPFVDNIYVARKDVPEADRQKFSAALLALREGKDDLVLKILHAQRFVTATDREYVTLREIVKEMKMF